MNGMRLGLGLWVMLVVASWGQILETYFVPMPEDQMNTVNLAIAGAQTTPSDSVRSVISIVGNGVGTIVYYDHWEDGYEANLAAPTQSTTEIWGDNDPSNGIPPGFTTDLIGPGDIAILDNTIDHTDLSPIDFDGRDKIGATVPVAVTRAGWHISPGEVLAGAVEVQNVEDLGSFYVAPFGENTDTASGSFKVAYMNIMSTFDNTIVQVDVDADGTPDITTNINQGEAFLVTDYAEGATVTANFPVQTTVMVGNDTRFYEVRWLRLTPRDQWVGTYCNPIGTTSASAPAYAYIFNPDTGPITVEVATTLGSSNIVVNGGTTAKVLLPNSSGSCYFSQNDEPFYASVIVDPTQSHDWGMTLIPECNLSSQLLIGWGPGSGNLTENGSPVWVTAKTNTTLYVDYDGDPATGALTDPNGNQHDEVITMTAYEMVRIFDSTDNDQTGTRVYTLDGTLLSAAWGQDPENSTPGNPFLDMGTTVLPVPIVSLSKGFGLANDINGNGQLDPGDSLRVTVNVINSGLSSLIEVTLGADFDQALQYIANSTTLDGVAVPDAGVTPFPYDEGIYNLGDLDSADFFQIQYEVILDVGFTNCSGQLDNPFRYFATANRTCAGNELECFLQDPIDIRQELIIDAAITSGNCGCPNQPVEFVVTVSNAGNTVLSDIDVVSTFGACDTMIPELVQGQSLTYTCSVVAAMSGTNVITASTDPCGVLIADTASAPLLLDLASPVFTAPADVTLECAADAVDTGSPTNIIDDCDDMPLVVSSDTETTGSCASSKVVQRLWTVTDSCGNASTATQIITFADTTAPTFTVPADTSVACGTSTEPSVTGDVTTKADNCDPDPAATYVDATTPGACPQEQTILRVWTVTDACANSAMATQTIQVVDDLPPSLVPPADITLECDASTAPANAGTPGSVTDNCDPAPGLSSADTAVPGSCPAEQTILRVWTATDACGNSASATQVLTIVDTTAPTATIPADATVECDAAITPDALGQPTNLTDNCDAAPTFTSADNATPGACPQEQTIDRVWTIIDACGNTSVATQTITVVDTTNPTFTVPADTTIECGTPTVPTFTGTPTRAAFNDNCDPEPNITRADTVTPGACAGASTIVRAWTVTDACGNATTLNQTINVVDTTPPTFIVPGDVTIECDSPSDPANTGDVTVKSDNCDPDPAVSSADTMLPGDCADATRILRAWTVTDACGNVATSTQNILVVDTTPPTFTVPADMTLECDASTGPANAGSPTLVMDNCTAAPVVTSNDTSVPGNCPQEQTILRVWTVRDACFNTSSATQTLTIVDTMPPSADFPADTTIECDVSTGPDNTGSPTAIADNCDVAPAVSSVDAATPGACPQEQTISRVWTITDACGNAISATQIITVVDTVAPSFTQPADVTIECDAPSDPANTGMPQGIADNCDPAPMATSVDTVTPGSCPNESSILRAWTVTDACGNTTVLNQTITIVDTTAPTFTVPANVTIECDTSTDPVNTGDVTVKADNCDADPAVTSSDATTPGACVGQATILRTWTVTDACGNATSSTQTISVVDTTPPVVTCPTSGSVEGSAGNCGWRLPALAAPVTDNCSPADAVTVTQSPAAGTALFGPGVTPVTITATDACGNETVCTVEITILCPILGLAKSASSTVNNGDGSYDVTYLFTIENLGNLVMNDLELFDDIVGQFAGFAPTSFTALDGSLTANPAWDGSAASNILEPGQSIAIGETETVSAMFTVTPTSNNVDNTATVGGTTPGGQQVIDASTDGIDPDPDGSGTPDEMTPTPTPFPENPRIGLAKATEDVVNNGDGTYRVTYRFTVGNYGDVPLRNIEITDDILGQFGTYSPTGFATLDGTLSANPNWNGTAASNILAPGQALAVGARGDVLASFTITPGSQGSLDNIANASGTSPQGTPVGDQSTDGVDPDPDGNNNPDEMVPTPTPFPENPRIGLAKQTERVQNNGDGSFTVRYRFTVGNYGDVVLRDIEIFDDILTQFAGMEPTGFRTFPGGLAANTAWDGSATSNILAPGQTLAVGQRGDVFAEFTVLPKGTASVNNIATASGTSPQGTPVNDQSTDGVDPDPDGNNTPDEMVPTPTPFSENPRIGLAKSLTTLEKQPDGRYLIEFLFTVGNYGDVFLQPVAITDDIVTLYADWTPTDFEAFAGTLPASNAYDGQGTSNILAPNVRLMAGESGTVGIRFLATPAVNYNVENTAVAIGTSPQGTPVRDTSTDGLNPDPDGNNVPDEEIPTPTPIPVADLSLTKNVTPATPFVGDTVTYTIVVRNDGPDDATGVTVEEVLPTGLTYVSDSSNGTYVNGIWNVGSVPVNAALQLDIQAVITTSDPVRNTAQVASSDQLDPDSVPGNDNPNEDDQASITITAIPMTTIRGIIWEDLDGDAMPGEDLSIFGLSQVRVDLLRAEPDGSVTEFSFAATVVDGRYEIGGVPPGDYEVVVRRDDVPGPIRERNTTPVTYEVSVVSAEVTDINFGFQPEPTAIELEWMRAFVVEGGVEVVWQTAWEDNTLGFFVHRVSANGQIERVGEVLTLARGNGEYRLLDAGAEGGRYVLEELTNDLQSDFQDTVAVAELGAPPVEGETMMMLAEDGVADFVAPQDPDNLMVIGFERKARVLDVTDPDAPRQLIGEHLEKTDDVGVFFENPAGADVFIHEEMPVQEPK